MKLLTYVCGNEESWGFLVDIVGEESIVFNPSNVIKYLKMTITPTSSLWVSGCPFNQNWPDDLVSFLAMEEKGMAELNRLYQYLTKALENGADAGLLMKAGIRLSKVKIKAPIPRPRLYFGLVQNGPPFIRNNPMRYNTNLFPQGHNRTQGSVIGYNDVMVFRENSNIFGCNVELGIVIGKKGRYIPAQKAMEYVAGFVPVLDACTDGYFNMVSGQHRGWDASIASDWFQLGMMSWCGKKADTMAPMGPFIVTKDEIVNVYDLLCYNRENGLLRDRTYTGCYMLGVERLINWYSSFATVYPGDVLHLGTMGVDGLCGDSEMSYGPDNSFEVEIEKIGSLKNRIVMEHINDWRDPEDESKKIHPSPAVRDLVKKKEDIITSANNWQLSKCRHYWTLYGNYKDVKKHEGLEISTCPRILNTPISSLSVSGSQVEIPPRASTLDIGVELACVIKKLAFRVNAKKADDFILGYTPLISISDRSFSDRLVQPATPQENSLPVIYGRWADNFNTVLEKPGKLKADHIYALDMNIEVEGFGKAQGSTAEYVLGIPQVLEFITRYITFFPGDIVTLGRIAQRITVPAHLLANKGPFIRAIIEDLPPVKIRIRIEPDRKQTIIEKKATVVGE